MLLGVLSAIAVFSPVLHPITPAGFESAAQPQLAIGADHRIYAAYGMGDDLYVSISTDKGSSFGAPIKVGSAGKLALGMHRGPRIAATSKGIVISAIYGVQGKGKDGNLISFRSSDHGKTWSKPSRVNDIDDCTREGLHAMAAGPDGTLACAWLDLRAPDGTTIYFTTSKDGGATWTPSRLAYKSPDGTVCTCCHPSLAFDAKGKLYLMFRNVLAGCRDMHLAVSTDLKAFSDSEKLGKGAWQLNMCPMDGGNLAIDSKGAIYTTWRRDTEVFAAMPNQPEQKLGDGKSPWLAMSSEGPCCVWQKDKTIVAEMPSGDPMTLSEAGTDPNIASSPDGKFVFAAWAENGIKGAVLNGL